MPQKHKKTEGQNAWVKKTSRTDIPLKMQAAVTALKSSGAFYSKIVMEIRVKSSSEYNIVRWAKKHASDN